MPRVRTSDGKLINFPAGMSQQDIQQEMMKLYPLQAKGTLFDPEAQQKVESYLDTQNKWYGGGTKVELNALPDLQLKDLPPIEAPVPQTAQERAEMAAPRPDLQLRKDEPLLNLLRPEEDMIADFTPATPGAEYGWSDKLGKDATRMEVQAHNALMGATYGFTRPSNIGLTMATAGLGATGVLGKTMIKPALKSVIEAGGPDVEAVLVKALQTTPLGKAISATFAADLGSSAIQQFKAGDIPGGILSAGMAAAPMVHLGMDLAQPRPSAPRVGMYKVSWEQAHPDTTPAGKLFPNMYDSDIPLGERIDVTNRGSGRIVANVLSHYPELKSSPMVFATGTYQDYPLAPSGHVFIEGPDAAVDRFLGELGYRLEQQEVVAHRMLAEGQPNAFMLASQAFKDPVLKEKFWNQLYSAVGEEGVSGSAQPFPDTLEIVNFTDRAWQPTQFERFANVAQAIGARMGIDLEFGTFASKPLRSYNDWGTYPNGEVHKLRANPTRDPEVERRLDSLHRGFDRRTEEESWAQGGVTARKAYEQYRATVPYEPPKPTGEPEWGIGRYRIGDLAKDVLTDVATRVLVETGAVHPFVELRRRPLGVEPTRRPASGATASVYDVARTLELYGRKKLPTGFDPTDAAAVEAYIYPGWLKEVKYAIEHPKMGRDPRKWYREYISQMEDTLQQIYPADFTTGTPRNTFYKAMLAAMSYGKDPNVNLNNAVLGLQTFNRTGKIPMMNPKSGKNWGYLESATATKGALESLEAVLEKFGGDMAKATEWLLTKHPISELREINRNASGRAGDLEYGALVMGPKGGDFFLNMNGIHDSPVVDLWMTRAYHRWLGKIIDPKSDVIMDGITEPERRIVDALERRVAKKLGLGLDQTQALHWYYEQHLYQEHGTRSNPQDYATAAERHRPKPPKPVRAKKGEAGFAEIGAMPGVRTATRALGVADAEKTQGIRQSDVTSGVARPGLDIETFVREELGKLRGGPFPKEVKVGKVTIKGRREDPYGPIFYDFFNPEGVRLGPSILEPRVERRLRELEETYPYLFSVDTRYMTKYDSQAGSNPGGFYMAEDGTKYYVKAPNLPAIAHNEILTSKIYQLLGIRVPELRIAEHEGKVAVASKIIPDLREGPSVPIEALARAPGTREGFVIDAWLANWDVAGAGYDNVALDEMGKLVRLDVGGGMMYRARGERKMAFRTTALRDDLEELHTLRDPNVNPTAAELFKYVTDDDILAGSDRLLYMDMDALRNAIDKYKPVGVDPYLIMDILESRRYAIQGYADKIRGERLSQSPGYRIPAYAKAQQKLWPAWFESRGIGPEPLTLMSVAPNHERELLKAARGAGQHPETVRMNAERKLKEALDTAAIQISVDPGTLMAVLKSGGYYSQFVTGITRGSYHPEHRARTEAAMFGYQNVKMFQRASDFDLKEGQVRIKSASPMRPGQFKGHFLRLTEEPSGGSWTGYAQAERVEIVAIVNNDERWLELREPLSRDYSPGYTPMTFYADAVSPYERPVYGHATLDGPFGHDAHSASHYGSSPRHGGLKGVVQIELKERVKDRATILFGDSLGGETHYLASPYRSPKLTCLTPQADVIQRAANLPIESLSTLAYGDYAEVQVHGGVTPNDFYKVHFSVRPDTAITKRLAALGIKFDIQAPAERYSRTRARLVPAPIPKEAWRRELLEKGLIGKKIVRRGVNVPPGKGRPIESGPYQMELPHMHDYFGRPQNTLEEQR